MSREQRTQLDAMVRRPIPTSPLPIEQMRAGFAALMAMMRVPEQVRTGPTIRGGRPAVVVEPGGAARPGTILYFHGGSFMLGSPQTAMSVTANLVVRTGIRAVSLDYRLAPEHPFPAGLEDALAAYRGLLDEGIDPASIAFAGESAGGGIAIGACLMARDAGLPLPAVVVTFSAGLDATRSGASMQTKEGLDPFFTRDSLMATSELYLGGQDPQQPLLSPAVCADLTGFPPLLLQVGTNEVLLDDSRSAHATRVSTSSSTSRRACHTSTSPSQACWTRPTRPSTGPPCSSPSTSPGTTSGIRRDLIH
jgi:monoterpene epsilon-lactone hydrolase